MYILVLMFCMSSNVTKKAIFHYLQVAYFYLILYAICDFNGFD